MTRAEHHERAHERTIPGELAGARFDQALARLFPEYSRSRLARWIRLGRATVDGEPRRPRDRVAGGERVTLEPEPLVEDRWQAEPIALSVVHEDEALLVVDKPAGLVVHPGAGVRGGTLVNALLHHDPSLAAIPRAGVVHRLDKDTSGLLVVAKTLGAHKRLVAELKARAIEREYLAIVLGRVTAGGRVDAPVGRHRVKRTRMAVSERGRSATTHFRVQRRFRAHTLLRVRLETGRTHQIRVHMAHIGHPVLGDPTYGGRLRVPPGAGEDLAASLRAMKRQALHAAVLELRHPESGRRVRWTSPLPADMAALLRALERDRQAFAGPGEARGGAGA